MSSSLQRVLGVVVLAVTGVLGLPLVASVLDGEATESLIIPVHLVAMAAIGAGVAVALPALARAGASTGSRALTGAGWGVLVAVIGVVVFWLLLNGLGGA